MSKPPTLTPVSRHFLIHSLLRKAFPGQRLGLKHLRWGDIWPEDFDRHLYPPEYIILILASGGWVTKEDWRPYVRLAIAHRLKALAANPAVWVSPFDDVREELLKTQLYGGTFADHATLRTAVRVALKHVQTTPQHKILANLVRSVVKDPQWEGLLMPMWWIRAALIHTDHIPFGMSNMRHEQVDQRKILLKMLHSALPKGIR